MVPMVKFPESHRLRSQSHRSDAYCLYGKLHERCTCLETTLKILPRLQGSYELLRLELVLCICFGRVLGLGLRVPDVMPSSPICTTLLRIFGKYSPLAAK